MLCHPILDQPAFCAAGSSPAVLNTNHKPATPSFYTSSPYNTHHTNNNTPSSSSLYSIPLPQQPHMQQLDSFSTPSSATPSSLPAVRSWHQQPAHGSSSVGSNNISATTTPKQPLILDSLAASKAMMVENLVDTAALIIESIWPSSLGAPPSTKAPVIPLHIFVKETLRRSRTTLSTLQLALYYIYKVRSQVLAAQEKIRQDQRQHLQQQQPRPHSAMQHRSQPLSPNGSVDLLSEEEEESHQRDYFNSIALTAALQTRKNNTLPMTPPGLNNTPAALSPLSMSSLPSSSPILAKSEPVGCGRRMFLAALILASKFQQDRTYSNKAWSKISGLPVSEINLNEITFLALIDYRLFVSQPVFQKWVLILTEKGKLRDRASLSRCNTSVLNSDVPQPTRRSSIQYCNNTLPSRMTCVTASSLEQQQQYKTQQQPQQQQQSSQNIAPHLPSAPTLPRLNADNIALNSGLLQSEALPRQQQGMGSYLTHRWVQAQRREFIRSRMQSMGYNPADPAFMSSPATTLPQQQSQQQHQAEVGMILNNFQHNIITYSQARTFSLPKAAVEQKRTGGQEFPSPASSLSPKNLAGSKRRSTDDDELPSSTRRRLSVSFLVDC
ncbi:hypothetical protein BGZ70_009496 [Mortierella alpina]|uniref:G1/S-specific cyclin pas1 n=1 Tax=Mortierella alpina TaxID=64518 RepID=A0A9P6M0F3_MORAP|nr:hypothetical protein BGZ70_009496 [Mortierella alpina]